MSVSDPIANFLTQIRNSVKAKKKFVDVPSSNMKVKMAEIMKDAKFIKDFNVIEDNKQNLLRIHLQYLSGTPSITGLKKISKPGLRMYAAKENVPRVYNGLGIAIISTSKGLMTDSQARKNSVGGEIICHIW